jgi:hypothetical protein
MHPAQPSPASDSLAPAGPPVDAHRFSSDVTVVEVRRSGQPTGDAAPTTDGAPAPKADGAVEA